MVLHVNRIGRHVGVEEVENHDDDRVHDTGADLDQGVVGLVLHLVLLDPLEPKEGPNTATNKKDEDRYLKSETNEHLPGVHSFLFDPVRIMTEVLVPEVLVPLYAGIIVNVIRKAPLQADLGRLPFPSLYKDSDPDTH